MADKRKIVLSIYLLPLCMGLVAAQNDIMVEPTVATVRNGQNATFLCRSRRPLLYCRFEIPNLKPFRISEESQSNDHAYYGNGLQAGDCGVHMFQVDFNNNGRVLCTMGYRDHDDEGIGSIDLVVGLEPRSPQFETFTNQALVKDNVFEDRCIVADGRPGANISFFLDNEEIVRGVSPPEEYNQTDTVTVVRQIRFTISDQDNGKTLTCRAEHFAYPNGYKETKAQLRVHYAPVPESVKTIYGLQLERTAYVTVTIQSNPRPNTFWNIDNSIHISEGDIKDRYEAQAPKEVGEGKWNVTLVINKLSLEDTTKVYHLIADNQLGRTDYTIKISPSDAPISDLDMGAIIGIAVACILVIVIIGLIIAARATGRWCFAENSNAASSNVTYTEGVDEAMLPEMLPRRLSGREEINPTNDGKSDSGNNDERKTKLSYIHKEKKSNKRSRPLTKENTDEENGALKTIGQHIMPFKQRLMGMVARARGASKQYDENEEVMSNRNENDEENEKMSTETAIVEDDIPVTKHELEKKDPNQLIYAELDIKTQPVVQTNRPTGKKLIENPDKTEYAEILYVSPQTSATKDGESENKSKEIEIK